MKMKQTKIKGPPDVSVQIISSRLLLGFEFVALSHGAITKAESPYHCHHEASVEPLEQGRLSYLLKSRIG